MKVSPPQCPPPMKTPEPPLYYDLIIIIIIIFIVSICCCCLYVQSKLSRFVDLLAGEYVPELTAESSQRERIDVAEGP